MNLNDSPDPSGAALRLDLAGPGVTLDLAAGAVSIASDRLRDGIELKLTTVGSDARPLGSFRVTIQSVPLAPRALTTPALIGSGVIGEPVTVDPGSWADADALRLEWYRDGAIIEGAAEASYTPVAADDRTALTCRVTAGNASGETSAETAALAVRYPAPVATSLADLERLLDGDGSVAAGAAFIGSGLSFAVSGAGATIDAATGAVSIPTDGLLEATEVTVTATNSGGSASASFKASVKGVAPSVTAAPKLSGTGRIGAAISVDAGVWAGKPAPTITQRWLRNGSVIAGASAASYTPVAADDGAALTCRVTASNVAGEATTETEALPASWPAPVASGSLSDLELVLGDPAGSVAAGAAFTGAGLSFTVSGAGATIDPATGVVSVPTADLLAATTVTVTATNSGGSASASFKASVKGVAPSVTAAPKLSGAGKIGAAISVDAGAWAGKPAPTIARQWRRGAADIAGATGASYTPVAADDKAALTCRVTATNAVGSQSATTTAVQVSYPAPVANGTPLPDLDLVMGAAAGSVASAAAFTGAGLSYAVSGAGATIDAATGAVSVPTADLLAATTVTVTATNSGGSASVSFKASVKGVAPTVITAPKLGGAGKIGAAVSVDAGTWDGKPAPTIARQWRRGAADIAGATGTSYTPVAADDKAALTCRVTATNAVGSQSATTTAVQVSYPAPVANGTPLPDLDLVMGAAAGSVASAAAFTGAGLSFAVSGAGATIDATTGAVSIPTAAPLSPTTVTVTATNSGGSASASFKASVKGVDDPVAALGTPSAAFKAAAVAATLCGPISSDSAMGNTYSANSMVALGLAVLKGDTGAARDRAIEQAKRWLSPATTPFNRGGFSDNVCCLGSFLLLCLKKTPGAWELLTATEKLRADDCMTVHAFSGAFVMSDNNPWPTRNRTICGWPTASGQGQNQKTTNPNQSIMGPCAVLIAMAYFGGPAALKDRLTSKTPANVRADLASHGLGGTNLHDTMNWRQLGRTGPVGLAVGGTSSDAPTDAQIIAAVSGNPKYFGVDLNDYHQILAMCTYKRAENGGNNFPWIASGNYNQGRNSENPAAPNTPVLIARGWGGVGLNSSGTPITSNPALGCLWPTSRANAPGHGLVGAPAEIISANDDNGKRSSIPYSIEGMRSLVAAWAALWITGLLDPKNAEIAPVMPIMDRAVRFLEYAHQGWQSHDTTTVKAMPDNLDWQLGNLYESWTDVIYPALAAAS